jgi:hypothetical protein
MNKPSPRRRERRSRLPEVSQITGLIDEGRKLRLSVAALANYPLVAEPAREGVEALQNVTAKLELIADMIAGAKTRSRKRRTPSPETSPPNPSLDLGDATGGAD